MTDKMSSHFEYRTVSSKRSTAQGVVTRHLNNVRRIVVSQDRDQLENCKHQLDKLFNAKTKFDDLHDKLLEVGFLNAIDTSEVESGAAILSADVIAVCESANAWIKEQESGHDDVNQDSTSTGVLSDAGKMDADLWKRRYHELKESHTIETAELRSMVASLTEKLDALTNKVKELPERAASTPSGGSKRRVTFDGALNLTQPSCSTETNLPPQMGYDYVTSDTCERHVPHMSYGGHGHTSNAVDKRFGRLSTGPPPAHSGSYTSQRPLHAVPESCMSPPYVCSSRAMSMQGNDCPLKPLNLSGSAPVASFNEGYPSMQHVTTMLQQKMLDQTESHHRSLMASVNATTAKLSKFDGNPLDYAPFINGFDELFDSVLDNPRAKLAALLNHCEGRALKVIRWCSHKSAAEGYVEARKTLRSKFGTPFIVSQAWLAKLLGYSALRTPEELESFSCDLVCCRESLECLGYLGELQCTNTLRLLVVKLPIHLRNRWRKVHRQCIGEGGSDLLSELINLVKDAADDINDPAFSERAMEKVRNTYNPGSQAQRSTQQSTFRRGGTYSTLTNELVYEDDCEENGADLTLATGSERVTCSACSSTQHFTAKCRRYKEKTPDEKLKFVTEKNLCTLCLSSNHTIDTCSLPWRCQEKGCRDRHHTSLHRALMSAGHVKDHAVNALEAHCQPDTGDDEHCCVIGSMPCLPVTTIRVSSGNYEYDTYALLDNASTITLSTKRLSDKLHLEPIDQCRVNLNTISNTSEFAGDIVSFDVKDVNGEEYLRVNRSLTVKSLPVSIDHMARAEHLKQWDHLAKLKLPCIDSVTIDLLVGQDNAHLLVPLESIVGEHHQPYAVRTPLGWTVYGMPSRAPGAQSVNTCTVGAPSLLRATSHETSATLDHCTMHISSSPMKHMSSKDVHTQVIDKVGDHCTAVDDRSDMVSRGSSRVAESEADCTILLTEGANATHEQQSEEEVQCDAGLYEVLERFWKLDSFPTASRHTRDEQAVLDLWNREVKVVQGHIQLPIPYRKRPPEFPDNYMSALCSLRALGRRLKRNPDRLAHYKVAMMKNFSSNYAEYVKKGDRGRPGYTSYLTHHDVDHPRKPGVPRIVKSGKGKYKGVAMCELVFQGPDLMNHLNGVLLRFRQYEHASLADIEGMFNQVLVPEDERDSMRFLFWKNGDPDDEVVVCRMRTHIFGMVWSPAACMFALRKSTELFGTGVDEDILESIRSNFYVDDWHNSEPTEQRAIRKMKGVDEVVGRAGFNLTKHMSNNRSVIAAVPSGKRAKEVAAMDLSKDRLPKGVSLGMGWDPEIDSFLFHHTPEPKPETRRGLMSCVASLYDPLGLVAPFILLAKLMLQQACTRGAAWDDVLPESELVQWRSWLKDLEILSCLRIPRWLGATEDSRNTLHNFGDASIRAYGGASLLLTESVHGDFMDCKLVYAKSKLAPTKTQSIPRLELCAATVCVKLDEYLRDELDIHLESSFFWSDSMLVLFYIMGDPANYKPFMANRVAFCHEHTRKKQWNHIPGEQNPADVVSRGSGAEQLIKDTLLYHGPEFLRKGRAAWPLQRVIPKPEDDTEVRKSKAVYTVTCMLTTSPTTRTPCTTDDESCQEQLDILSLCTAEQVESVKSEVKNGRLDSERSSLMYRTVEVASSWSGIKRSIAWLTRFALWYQSGWKGQPKISDISRGPITADEMAAAETKLVTMAQRWHIDENSLKTCKSMKKLDVVKINGLWRVGGRLANACLTQDEMRPMVIPAKSAVARLIVLDAHERTFHAGVDRTVMEVRIVFWVCHAIRIARKIINTCVMCRRLRGRPAQQKMGNLPEKRLAFNTPPFFHTGVDLFGPLVVTVRRSTEKRYGVLYTCMSTRAVHIEVAIDLSTSSFLCTFERFTARRGTPESLQSDNGKNFVGGKAELKMACKILSDPRIARSMADRHIKWTTNSPSASHQGGIWERMIRSTRELLMVVLKGEVVSPDKLHTALCKIEHMINSRPITKLSNSPDSMAPLTPCDILTLWPPRPVFPFQFSGERYKRDFKQANYLLGEFWKCWIKRYLPELQKRAKWQDVRKNCYVGELVILVQDQYHRCDWPLGVIREVYPGSDGLVRNVLVKTKEGLFRRPIQKLIRLEGELMDPG